MGRFLNADALVSTGQGVIGNNMFAYCGNNPISNVDPAGMFFERTAGGGGGGLAYAGPASGHIVQPTTPLNIPLIIPYIPPSTTFGIDALRAEVIVIRQTQAKEEAQAIAITTTATRFNDAIYYGADRWGGEWKIVTPPMTYDDAKIWTATTAATHSYGKGASWGLYTFENDDAFAMAWDLGLGGMPIHDDGRTGEFSHYHVFGRDFLGFYKHFHVWYGSLL